jgi:hypothetical protein
MKTIELECLTKLVVAFMTCPECLTKLVVAFMTCSRGKPLGLK